MLLAMWWTQGLKKWHRDRERLCSYPVLSPDAYPCFIPFSRAVSPPSCQRPHLVLFVVLAQARGCQAKTWRTEGQLHVSFFPSSYLLASVLHRIVW